MYCFVMQCIDYVSVWHVVCFMNVLSGMAVALLRKGEGILTIKLVCTVIVK